MTKDACGKHRLALKALGADVDVGSARGVHAETTFRLCHGLRLCNDLRKDALNLAGGALCGARMFGCGSLFHLLKCGGQGSECIVTGGVGDCH